MPLNSRLKPGARFTVDAAAFNNDLSILGVLNERWHEDVNIVMKLLDGLAIGQQALAGIAMEVSRRQKGLAPNSVYQAMLNGIEKHGSFRDALPPGAAGWVGGTAMDLVIDPINIFGAPAVAKIWKKGSVEMFKAVERGLREIPPVNAAMDVLGDKLVKHYTAQRWGLHGIAEADYATIAEKNLLKARMITDGEQELARRIPDMERRKLMARLRAKTPHENIETELFNEFGRPMGYYDNPEYEKWLDSLGVLTPEEREAMFFMNDRIETLAAIKAEAGWVTEARQAGLLEKTGEAVHTPIRFKEEFSSGSLSRATKREMRALEAELLVPNISARRAAGVKKQLENVQKWSELSDKIDTYSILDKKALPVYKERVLHAPDNMSFQQARRFNRSLADIDKRFQDYVEMDAAKILGIEEREVATAMIRERHVRRIVNYLSKEGLILPEEFKGLGPEAAQKLAKKLGINLDERIMKGMKMVPSDIDVLKQRKMLIPEPAQKELERIFKAYENPSDFLKGWRKMTGLYKAITLPLFLGYHARNNISNWWQSFLGGMNLLDPRVMEDARHSLYLLRRFRVGIADDTVRLGFKGAPNETEVDVFRNVIADTIIDGGQFSELDQFMDNATPGVLARIFNPMDNPAVKRMYRFGRFWEDHARLTHYMWRRRTGLSHAEAVKSVNKYLFDYVHGLSPFVELMRDTAFPFITWTRFNLPLQLEALWMMPHKFAAAGKNIGAIESITGEAEESESILDEWLRNTPHVRWRYDQKSGEYQYFNLDGWYPAADILKALSPKEFAMEVLNLLTPYVKAPLESMIFNYSFFKQQKVEEFKGQKKKVLGVDLPARLEHLVRTLRPINEMDRMIGAIARELQDETSTTSLGERLASGPGMRFLFGLKSYPQDLRQQRREFDQASSRQIAELRTLLRRAKKRGDTANEKQIRKLIREHMKYRSEVLGITSSAGRGE